MVFPEPRRCGRLSNPITVRFRFGSLQTAVSNAIRRSTSPGSLDPRTGSPPIQRYRVSASEWAPALRLRNHAGEVRGFINAARSAAPDHLPAPGGVKAPGATTCAPVISVSVSFKLARPSQVAAATGTAIKIAHTTTQLQIKQITPTISTFSRPTTNSGSPMISTTDRDGRHTGSLPWIASRSVRSLPSIVHRIMSCAVRRRSGSMTTPIGSIAASSVPRRPSATCRRRQRIRPAASPAVPRRRWGGCQDRASVGQADRVPPVGGWG